MNKKNFKKKNKINGIQRVLIVLVFLAGILNSQSFFVLMGFNTIYIGATLLFYGLLVAVFFISVLNFLYNKKNNPLLYSVPYWSVLLFITISKFFILFIQFPDQFYPEGILFTNALTFTGDFSLMILLAKHVRELDYLKMVIWSLGLGAVLSSIIPLIFFPELIGTRVSIVEGYAFTGAFWNSAVISYISVGWLLIAISPAESIRFKKSLLLGIFLLLIIGCLAGLSRSALISILLSGIVYLIASNRLMKFIKVNIAVFIFLFGLIIFYPDIVNNFQDRLEPGININEESRTIIWKDYLEDISDYFILGEISGNFKKYSKTGQPPHSAFLNWFSQFGILGLIGFLMLLLGIIKSINKIRKNLSKQMAAGLYAWLVAYLSVATINETGFNHLTIFIAFGVILGWGNYARLKALNSE